MKKASQFDANQEGNLYLIVELFKVEWIGLNEVPI